MAKQNKTLDKLADSVELEVKKVSCSVCNRRRDLYFVGDIIYCIDHALLHLVSLVYQPK